MGTSDEEILKVIDGHFAPAVGTTDIAEEVGVSRQAVDRRLRELKGDGLVKKHKVGRSVVWWLSSGGEKLVENLD